MTSRPRPDTLGRSDLGDRLAGMAFPVFVHDPVRREVSAADGHTMAPSAVRQTAVQGRLLNGAALVRQSMLLVLQTEPGERVMRPEFGCGLARFLMEPNTPGTRADIARVVESAIGRWEPRVSVERVDVDADIDPSAVVVTILYRHDRDGSAATVRFPVGVGGFDAEVLA